MFKINDHLREIITKDIPESYSSRQKIILVYKRLCERLEYSMPAYINAPRNEWYYRKPEKLVEIDGEKRRDVMCFNFAAIFSEIVNGMHLPLVITYPPMLGKNKIFDPDHTALGIFIEGNEYLFDPLGGVIDNNDMNAVKSGMGPSGIDVVAVGGRRGSRRKVEKELLADVVKVFTEEKSELHPLAKKFEKLDEYDFGDLEFEKRVEILLKQFSEVEPPVSAMLLNYLIRVKRKLINREEDATKFDMKFLTDKATDRKLVFVCVNPKGYENRKGKENFDALSAFVFNFHSGNHMKLSREELLMIEQNPNICIDASSGQHLKFHFMFANEGYDEGVASKKPWIKEV